MTVLDLNEVKDALNIKQTATDDQINALIGQAESFVANRCGPLESTPQTCRVRGGGDLVLPWTPVLSVGTVTGLDSGAAVTVTVAQVDLAAGVIYGTFPEAGYEVAYTAGRTSCPDDLLRAALEICRHLWRPQRGAEQRSDAMSALRLAEDLMEPHLLPGFA